MRLTTARLLLRETAPADFEAIHAYRSDPEVALMTGFDPQTEQESQAFHSSLISSQSDTPRTVYWLAAELRMTDTVPRVIGNGTLRIRSSELREADIAFVLARNSWGEGFGTDIARSLLHLGFDELRLHRIYATCRPENLASARVLENIGMRREAHFREDVYKNGRWWDTLLFATLDYEWSESRMATP